jgi:trigger factor
VEVKAIKKRTLPELDDDFAKELGAYESFADLETRPRARWPTASAQRGRRNQGPAVCGAHRALPFPVPESLVQEQIDARLERGLRALAAQGMDTEQMRKLDFATACARPSATRRRRGEDLNPAGPHCPGGKHRLSDEELDMNCKWPLCSPGESADGYPESAIDGDGGLARIREQLRREKTAKALYERLPA